MEGNDCNKAIKIVTALAIIIFIFGASAILERNQLQKENAQLKEENGLRIESIPIKINVLPASNNQPAPSENTSTAKPINFSFRQELERIINTQYAPTTLQFEEIVCDRVPYDENCYVRYDIGNGGYWITVPKKYADDWR